MIIPMSNNNITPEIFASIVEESKTAIQDFMFCELLDSGFDPGTAYEEVFNRSLQILDPCSSDA